MRNNKTLKNQSGSGRRPLNTLKQTNRKKSRDVRSFSVLNVNGKDQNSGRFLAVTPKAAASKAFTSWCREHKKKGECAASITVYETTRGNSHKKYSYNAARRVHNAESKYRGKTRGQDVKIVHKYVNVLYTTKNVRTLKSPSKSTRSGGSRKNRRNKTQRRRR